MTKGNPKLITRVSAALLDEMREAIGRRNARTREEPWDMSAFVRCAIRDKLQHMKRSRRKAGSRRSRSAQAAQSEG